MLFSQLYSQRGQQRSARRRKSSAGRWLCQRRKLGVEMLESRTMLTAAAGDPYGILLLDPSARMALYNTGGGVHVTGGDLVIDSNNRQAALQRGPGNITANEIDVTGGLARMSGGQFQQSVVHTAPLADPWAGITAPSPDLNKIAAVKVSGNTVLTLLPGTYVGGIHLTGNAHVTLSPGLYYLQGGGLSVLGNAHLTGSGVTIYNAPGSIKDDISFGGNCSVALSAATSGDYQGLVLFQNRQSTAPIMMTGGSVNLCGAVYTQHGALSFSSGQNLNINGSADLGLAGEIVVGRLYNGGRGRLNVDATPHPLSDLSVTVDDFSTTTLAGSTVTYNVTVSNDGPIDIWGAELVDGVSSPYSFEYHYVNNSESGAWAYATSYYGQLQEALNLPAYSSLTYQVQLQVNSAADANTIGYGVEVLPPSGTGDRNWANNVAIDTDTVIPQADLQVSVDGPGQSKIPGSTLVYDIVAGNTGISSVQGASVTASIPSQGVISSYTISGTDGFTASGTGDINFTDSNLTFASDQFVDYTVNVVTDPESQGVLTASASISGAGASDTNLSNNSASYVTSVVPPADLAVTIDDGVTSAVAGGSVIYTITVTNNGPNDVVGANIVDMFPIGLGSLTLGGTLNNPNPGNGGYILFTNGTLTSLNNFQGVVISATSPPTAALTVSGPGPLTFNTSSSVNISSGSNTYSGGTFNSGSGSITINGGGGNTFEFDKPLASVSYTAVATDGATGFTASGSGNINDTVDMPAGSSITYTVTANLNQNYSGTLTDNVSVTGPATVPDLDSSNNTASDADIITLPPPQADVAISVTDGVDSVAVGQQVNYTIVVSNNGPTSVSGVTIANQFPTGLTLVGATETSTGGATQQISGSIISIQPFGNTLTLPSGSTFTYHLTAVVNSNAVPSLADTATATLPSGTTDPNLANNTATDTDSLLVTP